MRDHYDFSTDEIPYDKVTFVYKGNSENEFNVVRGGVVIGDIVKKPEGEYVYRTFWTSPFSLRLKTLQIIIKKLQDLNKGCDELS